MPEPETIQDCTITTTDRPLSLRDRYYRSEVTGRQAIVDLALSFPTLRSSFPWLTAEKWEADKFDKMIGPQCDGAIHAARFVLSVWNPHPKRKCGKFDLHNALSCWDRSHRAAFVAWAQDPWWA